MLSEAPSGTTTAGAAAELIWLAADPDRACETRRRGARWRLRAGLFASPVSAPAALFACLRGCLLAMVFVLWIRIAHRDACTTTSLALGARQEATRRGRRHGQQCLPCRGSRAQSVAEQRFFAARPASQKPQLAVGQPAVSTQRKRGPTAPCRCWHWSNCAPKWPRRRSSHCYCRASLKARIR